MGIALELAIELYRTGKMPSGRAANVVGMRAEEFDDILRERQVPMPYSLTDLEHDLAYANAGD